MPTRSAARRSSAENRVTETATPVASTPDASAVLADLVAGTPLSDLPSSALDAARLDVLDTLGCAIAGRTALGVAEVTALLLDWGGKPVSAVWGSGQALPPPAAAFANAMSGHALDYDDMHPGITHTGVSVIPAAVAVAEAVGCRDMDQVLGAIILGTEVADRIAVSVLDGPGVTGWLLTPLVGYFGAATAAARLLGLDALRTRHALGFAYVQASGNGQSTLDGALAKRMQPGFAARGGVFAAELARRGLTGPLEAFEGSRGFFHVYHRDRYEPEVLRTGHMPRWMIEEATYKPYPCCGWTHAALECALEFRSRGVRAEEIAAARIAVNAQAYRSTGTPLPRRYRPATPVDAQFSIPYTFATAFVTGAVTLEDFTTAALERKDVLTLGSKVSVEPDEHLEGRLARDLSPARAFVELSDGRTLEARVIEPVGQSRPLGRDELLTKFVDCCRYAGRSNGFTDEVAGLVLEGRDGDFPRLVAVLSEGAA